MIPTLHLPGEIIPGQFGPISRDRRCCRNSQARTMSSVGIPSVMHTINSICASAASMMASAAKGGGTKITVASAEVSFTACCTVLNTGQPSWVVPPLPGVTPPTICVPYSAQAFAWNVPSRPVRPCTITRVDLSTRMLILLPRRRYDFFGGILHGFCHDEIQAGLLENLSPLFDIGAFQPQHDR